MVTIQDILLESKELNVKHLKVLQEISAKEKELRALVDRIAYNTRRIIGRSDQKLYSGEQKCVQCEKTVVKLFLKSSKFRGIRKSATDRTYRIQNIYVDHTGRQWTGRSCHDCRYGIDREEE